MPRANWLLQSGSPIIQIALVEPLTGFTSTRTWPTPEQARATRPSSWC